MNRFRSFVSLIHSVLLVSTLLVCSNYGNVTYYNNSFMAANRSHVSYTTSFFSLTEQKICNSIQLECG